MYVYRMFRAQADWTLTHTCHKDIEQSTTEASITLDGVTLTDSLIRWSPNKWPSVCREIPVSADKMFWKSKSLHSEHYISREREREFMLSLKGKGQMNDWISLPNLFEALGKSFTYFIMLCIPRIYLWRRKWALSNQQIQIYKPASKLRIGRNTLK
jgi:hypothetical protein